MKSLHQDQWLKHTLPQKKKQPHNFLPAMQYNVALLTYFLDFRSGLFGGVLTLTSFLGILQSLVS